MFVQLSKRVTRALVILIGCNLAGACSDDEDTKTSASSQADTNTDAEPERAARSLPYGEWADPLALLPSGAKQNELACKHAGNDKVRDLFCGEQAPDFKSLVDMDRALGIDPESLGGKNLFTFGTATAHSTALGLRSVSAINPRTLILALPAPPQELLVIGYARGEQYAEVVVRDREDQELRFYVIAFKQECNDSPEGCKPGDLLTEAVEHDWRGVTLYDEETLANTVMDCATCHQPDGPGTPKLLRMQEFEPPWTHWFFKSTPGGRALLEDFKSVHGEEPYAGVPYAPIENSTPGSLSMLAMFAGSKSQPNMFDSFNIEAEVEDSAAARGGEQPEDNRIPGESPTWQALYERSKRGEAIPVPYHDVKVTDADKLERMTKAYQDYRNGELAREDLPDIRDVFPDDPKLLAEMGMATEPGLDGEAVLVQACAQCHNERLDQSLSRARFVPDMQAMSRQEKDLAITRLMLPPTDPFAMPPARLRMLTDEARTRAIEALKR